MFVLSIAVTVMTVHSTDVEILRYGLQTCGILFKENRINKIYNKHNFRDLVDFKSELLELGVCDTIVKAIRSSKDIDIVLCVCDAIYRISNVDGMTDILGEKGVCSAIVDAMNNSNQNYISPVYTLCASADSCDRLLAAGVWSPLMDRHKDDVNLSSLCYLAYSLIHHSSDKERAVQQMVGARAAVVRAMHAFNQDTCSGDLRWGIEALCYLVKFDCSTSITELECQVLVTAMQLSLKDLSKHAFASFEHENIFHIQAIRTFVKADSSCIPKLVDAKCYEAVAFALSKDPDNSNIKSALAGLQSTFRAQQSPPRR
jgi:hypothetical protein